MALDEYETELKNFDHTLIDFAKETIEGVYRKDGNLHHTLGSALQSVLDMVYTGFNTENQSYAPGSCCAEKDAVDDLQKGEGESHVNTIVTYKINNGASRIIIPCGGCVELLTHFGNPYIIATRKKDGRLCKVRLDALMRGNYISR
jgi:cytidine deaminase